MNKRPLLLIVIFLSIFSVNGQTYHSGPKDLGPFQSDSLNRLFGISTFNQRSIQDIFYESSNLPIIIINTNGNNIPDEPKIAAAMGVIDHGKNTMNHFNDPYTTYYNNIGIELRGASSIGFPKKSYGIELRDENNNAYNDTLLGLPSENDWILFGPYADKSLIRNSFTYYLSNRLGNYASRNQYFELVLNDVYQGVYCLFEKIKRDKNRVDIAELTANDKKGDDLTGGYIIKIDKNNGSNSTGGWESDFKPYSSPIPIFFQYHYPKYDDMLQVQRDYIINYVNDFETALHGDNFKDAQNGYRKYIDVKSFIDYFIINECSRNVDGYRISTFMYKDRLGKLTMGPVWDYDLAWGNANYYDAFFTAGWMYSTNLQADTYVVPFWWTRLLQDPYYTSLLKCRWEYLRQTVLNTDSMINHIEDEVSYIHEAQVRNFETWPILGTYVWPNYYVGQTYSEDVNFLEDWITERMTWLDNNMPGICYSTKIENVSEIKSPFTLFPNPTRGLLYVRVNELLDGQINIKVTDVNGKLLLTRVYSNSDSELDLTGFENGIYFVTFSGIPVNITYRIIKQ